MIGLSTAWRSKAFIRGRELVDELLSTGADGLELDYRIPPALFSDMRPALERTVVMSVHNYFPVPDRLLPSQGSGDAFLLTSPDDGEREAAVAYTISSLRVAGELGARHLVVHLGEVDCGSKGRELVRLYREKGRSDEFELVRCSLIEERREKEPIHLDFLFASLEAVLKVAREVGVTICVENRFYPHQIPSIDEVGEILDRFDGGPIRYWHDMGHAWVQERLGFAPRLEWLKRYGQALAGIHLHDAVGIRDHLAPGCGEVPFEEIRPYLNSQTVKVVEVHSFVAGRDLRNGIEWVRRNFEGRHPER